ncbi:Tripartite ATP-independent periplasmic transporter DctQ component [uncultured delta proteobacterium]|uniref:Tripartite ATP-independent periplasmic transporter DctQ component n=1 Tax=uncultured delta proteobacterium TaxID=34034 RepID=A0A212J8G9_9DELT|nr:Tripartite ATP-independent periplasmic transporter DctQ component [uncultured delta proteobacterium]
MKIFERFFMWVSGASLTIVFLVTFFQVIQRYLFSISLPWATDIIRIFFIYSVFCGMCVGIIRKTHLNIDVVLQLVSARVKIMFGIISNCIVMFFLATVMRYSISFIELNADQTTPYILFPMSYVYAIFPVTIVIMLAALLLDTYRSLRTFAGKEEGAA